MTAKTLFCKLPENFDGNTYHTAEADANRVKSVVDRRFDTFSTEDVFVLDLTDHESVTHLWVKATGIDSVVAVDASNANLVNLTDTSTYTVENVQGVTVDHSEDGFDNYLFDVRDTSAPDTAITTTEITVTLTGTDRKLYEIAALDAQVELDAEGDFSQFDFTPVWRGWATHRMGTGRLKGILPVNSEPPRRDLALTILYLDNASHQPIVNFLSSNPNFALVPEYGRYPHIVFSEATLPNWQLQVQNIVEDLKNHQSLSLTIGEA